VTVLTLKKLPRPFFFFFFGASSVSSEGVTAVSRGTFSWREQIINLGILFLT